MKSRVVSLGLVLVAALSSTTVAFAAKRSVHHSSVRYAEAPRYGGAHPLVNDGPGTPLGFHQLPPRYRIGARIARNRQVAALHETVETDALTSGGFRSGFLGDDVAASVPYSNYGVFSGADGYGSPFFAGYYGPGDGADLGPLGHTYAGD
jgi:hypothetical protein